MKACKAAFLLFRYPNPRSNRTEESKEEGLSLDALVWMRCRLGCRCRCRASAETLTLHVPQVGEYSRPDLEAIGHA